MNLFETLIRPDKEEHPERAEIARAANLLQIGEFQVLQLAWAEWHGSEMPPAVTDRLFGSYMLQNRVPHWARAYARRIIAQDAAGTLDEGDPRFHRYDPPPGRALPTGVRRFALATAVVMGCVFGGIYTAHLETWRGGNTGSVLPPYFSDKALKRPSSAEAP